MILLFVGLQQLEGHVVAPQVFRISLRVNPILIILALLIGYQLYGVVGALVALPVIAVVRQTVVYLRRHLVLEPWGSASPVGPAGSGWIDVGRAAPSAREPGARPTGRPADPAALAASAARRACRARQPSGLVAPPEAQCCPDCGAQTSAEDAYCRSCGASLAPRVHTTG